MGAFALNVLHKSSSILIPRWPPVRTYTRAEFKRDAIAAATVATITIPQAIGYALLAGLPPVHGLYAALIGTTAGALWSGSRFLSTGPIAIVGLLTLTTVSPLAAPGSPEFIALVAALALAVGVIQIGMGLARLGFLVRLVPQSVLVGFSSAAALIIAATQLPHLFGFPGQHNEFVLQIVLNIFAHVDAIEPTTAIIGCSSLTILLLLRKAFPKLPGALIILAVGITASFILDLGSQGVALAGVIPARLPITDIPNISLDTLLVLLKKAVVLALIGFMTSYAIAKDIARRTRENISPDQELVGQGFANIFSGLFRGYPVGGSLSRTAVNFDAGAATQWASIFVSVIIALTILFLSPVIAYLPNAVLAATLIATVVQLVDLPQLRRMQQTSPIDGIVAGTTFFIAFILRPDDAILIGVILALALFVHRLMWSDVEEVAIDQKWNVLRAIPKDSSGIERLQGTLVLRISSSFFYGNSERLLERMREKLDEREAATGELVRNLVLDFAGVDSLDITAAEGLGRFFDELAERDVVLRLMYPRRDVRTTIARTEHLKKMKMVHNIAELRQIARAAV
jgi:SulP family sulfate permease